MRKILSFFLLALVLAPPGGVALARTPGGSTATLRGDVNVDGQITAVDALAVLRVLVGNSVPAGHYALPNGGADNSGHLSALDALIILGYAVNKESRQYPVGQPLV